MKLLVFLFALLFTQGFTQEPSAPVECPPESRAVSKYEPQKYDGQNFESGFEYGAEYIDIGGMNWNDEGEVWMVTWFIQFDSFDTPINAAYMKAGNTDSQLFIYDPPKVKETPPEPITIKSAGQGISHITWCSPLEPTAITISSFEVNVSGTYTALFLLAVGISIILLLVLSIVVTRTWRK